jgi:5'-nucleotidase
MTRPWILVSNDDGIEASGLLTLVSYLQRNGWGVIVYAPASECSASSMHLSLHKNLRCQKRSDLISRLTLDPAGPTPIMYSIDGMPSDCLIMAIDGLLEAHDDPMPRLCVSGINRGPNMSVDILHSGTVAAARESALYGLPAIATSLTTFEDVPFDSAAIATVSLIEMVFDWLPAEPSAIGRPEASRVYRTAAEIGGGFEYSLDDLRTAFSNGDIYLNLNTPLNWSREWSTTRLGARWYHGASHYDEETGICKIGAIDISDDPIPDGESVAIQAGFASISPLATWPQTHPLNVGDLMLKIARKSVDGLPFWL